MVNTRYLHTWETSRPEFKPVKVDRFLQQFIWSYGEKILLTSATIPYRDDISKWLKRIGLGDKRHVFLKAPMTFPVNNRPIYLDYMGGKLTSKEKEKSWDGCVKSMREILEKHAQERGVIHCSSYKMMWRLKKNLKGYSLFLHDKRALDGDDVIQAWQESGKRVLISPSVFEGIDLKDEMCRFQVLFKVPYAFLGDQRVYHLVNEKKDWEWYNNEAATKIIQAYGRAVRHPKDHASFYIIDGSFANLLMQVSFPKWFLDAIEEE